jgi:hypothetical protein
MTALTLGHRASVTVGRRPASARGSWAVTTTVAAPFGRALGALASFGGALGALASLGGTLGAITVNALWTVRTLGTLGALRALGTLRSFGTLRPITIELPILKVVPFRTPIIGPTLAALGTIPVASGRTFRTFRTLRTISATR